MAAAVEDVEDVDFNERATPIARQAEEEPTRATGIGGGPASPFKGNGGGHTSPLRKKVQAPSAIPHHERQAP